jgi:hypothetical protein
MNISLKLTPIFDDTYNVESQCLIIPVNFSYEDVDRSFVFTVSGGLNIVGKPCPESRFVSYFIGETCTIETLSEFITKISRGLPAQIVLGSSEDGMSISSIEYNASDSTWTHRTESIDKHTGGSISFKLSPESLKRFVESLIKYKKFATIQITGHKGLWEIEENVAVNEPMDTDAQWKQFK